MDAGGTSDRTGRERINSSSSFKDSLSKFVPSLSGIVGQIGPISAMFREKNSNAGTN